MSATARRQHLPLAAWALILPSLVLAGAIIIYPFYQIVVLSLTAPSSGLHHPALHGRIGSHFDVYLLTATELGSTTREGPSPLALDSDCEAVVGAMYLQDLWVFSSLLREVDSIRL